MFVTLEWAKESFIDYPGDKGLDKDIFEIIETDEQPFSYTIITNRGYWGKGKTPEEAAKSANVNGRFCGCRLYYADQKIVMGEINVDGMGGHSFRRRNPDDNSPIETTKGKGRMIKGKLKIIPS